MPRKHPLFLILIPVIVILLCVLSSFAAFAEEPPEDPDPSVTDGQTTEEPVDPAPACAETGEHVYETYTPAKEGTHTAVCTLCGAEAELPCDYGETPVFASNGDGTHSAVCLLCGGKKTEACAYTDETIAPKQTERGYTLHTCAVCGYRYEDGETEPEGMRTESRLVCDVNADGVLSAADARLLLRAVVSLEALPDPILPFADADGDGTLSSADARIALRRAVDLDTTVERHDYAVTVTLPATCVAPGKATYACRYCDSSGEMTVPAAPHDFGEPVVTPSTCTQNGSRVRTCRACGAKNVVTLSLLGHSWTQSGETVICAVCKSRANGFVDLGGSTYHCVNGVKDTSWQQIGGGYYFFDRFTGAMQRGGKADGLALGADGRAAETSYSVEKIKTFMKARRILDSITEPTDSVSDKKYKAFIWVMKKPYAQYREVGEAMQTEGFEMLFANDIFDRGNGCCGSTSYAFAFLAVEAGCHEVYVNDDGIKTGGHAWVTMEGNNRVYDVIFAEAKSFSANYDAAVTDYRKYQPRMTYVGG